MYLDWEEQINTLSKSNFSNHCRKVIRVWRFPIAAKTKRIHNLGCSTVPPHPGDRDLNSSPGISGLKIQEDGEVTEWKLYLLRVSVMRKTYFFFRNVAGQTYGNFWFETVFGKLSTVLTGTYWQLKVRLDISKERRRNLLKRTFHCIMYHMAFLSFQINRCTFL